MPDAVALARLETDMMGKVMALASDLGDALARPRHGILVDDLSAADLIELFTVLAADNAPHRHMLRIRAPTSRRTCLGSARPDAAATTIGHVVHSNNGSRVAGMNRVRAA